MITPLCIATYNIENLEKPEKRYSEEYYSYQNKLYALSRVIDEIGADVIGLQEVGGLEELNELNSYLDVPYTYVECPSGNSHRRNHLAFLSHHPLKITSHRKTKLVDLNNNYIMEYASPRDLKTSKARFRRDLLQADVLIDNHAVSTVFNLHLKSNLNYSWTQNSPEVVRLAEANTAASLVHKHNDAVNYPVIVIGDFNDRPGGESIRPLHPRMQFCDIIALDFKSDHYEEAYTFHSKKFRSRIDFILLSDRAMKCYRKNSVNIFNKNHAKRASDHFPAHITLDL